MDISNLLREMADNWMLVGMFTFYIGVIIFACLPSQKKAREDASMIPMRDDTPAKTCSGTCDSCASAKANFAMKGLSNG
jgi:cytochrome c oxidase cbb3-type subunit 4